MTTFADSPQPPPPAAPLGVDTSGCDREPIHLANAIQPHGTLLVVAEPDLTIVQAGANCGVFFSEGPEALAGRPLHQLLGASDWARLQAELAAKPLTGTLDFLLTAVVPAGKHCHVFGNRIDGLLVLEWEPAVPPSPPGGVDRFAAIAAIMRALQQAVSIPEFFTIATARVRELSGFERVMAYRFADDLSGEVIAESKAEELEPYLGLHFPASDIPEPARRLFALSWLRHLPDVDYAPAPLLPADNGRLPRPVDLTHSFLRSVSPQYTDYLRNMGAKATVVMPLVREGRLWGLISCMNHSAPLYLPYEQRLPLAFLAQLIALQTGDRESQDILDYRDRLQRVAATLVHAMDNGGELHAVLAGALPNLLSAIDAGGAAVVTKARVTQLGETPSSGECLLLADWLAARQEPLLATAHLARHYPPAAAYAGAASGVLAVRLSRTSADVLLWFRPESPQEVHWAGDPRKPVTIDTLAGTERLRPRASFALWKETVRDRSRPWLDCEVEHAAQIRRELVDILAERARRLSELNSEPERSNQELDSFAYAASHDLKEPLRSIHNFVEMLRIEEGGRLSDLGRQRIDTIIRQSGRMEALLQSLLHYSRVGRVDLDLRPQPLAELLGQIAETVRQAHPGLNMDLEIGELPPVPCDRARVFEVLQNLIVNAVKYNEQPVKRLRVGCEAARMPPVFFVQDNGIGIAPQHHQRTFQLFRRLHGGNEYGGGTGAGLTIAKKSVERHGGRIWVSSAPGQGSTFYFTLAPETDAPEGSP